MGLEISTFEAVWVFGNYSVAKGKTALPNTLGKHCY